MSCHFSSAIYLTPPMELTMTLSNGATNMTVRAADVTFHRFFNQDFPFLRVYPSSYGKGLAERITMIKLKNYAVTLATVNALIPAKFQKCQLALSTKFTLTCVVIALP